MSRQEELPTGGETEEVGDDRAEGLSAIGEGGQAAMSLMPDVDGTGSGSLLEIQFYLPSWNNDPVMPG